jgi:ribosomal protein L7/L12
LAAFRAAKKKGAAQDARVKALAEGLRDPLRSEITALVKAGKKIDAIRHYQVASGDDLTTAKGVVEALEASGR